MDPVEGSKTFAAGAAAYDRHIGRYSRSLATLFADAADVRAGMTALDVGCGPGALTAELVGRLGAEAVVACDPTPAFAAECAQRHPGVDVRVAAAEDIPFGTATVDRAMAQLVLHFVSDPDRAVQEMCRTVRPGGRVAACVWDFADGMEMLSAFWDVALRFDPDAPDQARTLRFGGEGEIAELFSVGGLVDVEETLLTVTASYRDMDDLWEGFARGVGPAGAYAVALDEAARAALRDELHRELGAPAGPFALRGVARCAVGTVDSPSPS